MKIQWKKLLISVAIPLGVGLLAGLLTSDSTKLFESVNKPPLAPPAWLFPVTWSVLYVLMGIAFYRVWIATATYAARKEAFLFYALQLGFNFFWPIIFFNMQEYLFAFVWLLVLWVLILLTQKRFAVIDRLAGYLLIPYLVWVAFAGYLNLGIWWLN
jgi:tryptophan-rich sensory protein